MPASAEALFAGASFAHPWRRYQARVLDGLGRHLDDRHLHVVAPPGSGKTVLGLEVLRRIGRPALVLTPTLAVREQWLRRLEQDFLAERGDPAAVSRDLAAPAALTVSTYQALAREFQDRRQERLLARLRRIGLDTLVVDEAHHLRRFWWRCLTELEAAFEELRVIALTATPPYDVPQAEWNRYAAFCGPVDEEIGVPELVREGDLCPHQDLVYLSEPQAEERQLLEEFRRRVDAFVGDLALDFDLVELLAVDPRVASPERHADEILADPELYLAIAVYLRGLRWEASRELLRQMGLGGVELPPFDLEWAELLLDGLLSDDAWAGGDSAGLLADRRARLQAIGGIERGRVHLRASPRGRRLLRQSPSKLASICRIVEAESATGPDRRIVVLADHVREAALAPAVEGAAARPLVKIGVVPIFETLRRLRLPGLRPAVLTGKLIVLPIEAVARLGRLAPRLDLGGRAVRPLTHAPDFARVELGRRSVGLVTRLLGEGTVNCVVGTASLLGEGWDAPAVDTLILASRIGSYVSSNQMRGRAIRALAGEPAKSANIWHLLCVEPGRRRWRRRDAGDDLERLRRRFDAFVGLAHDRPALESGIARLGEELDGALAEGDLEELNRRMVAASGRRHRLAARWREALGPGTTAFSGRLVRELRLPGRRLAPRLLVGRRLRRSRLARWLVRRRLARIGGAVAAALARAGRVAGELPLEVDWQGDRCRVAPAAATERDATRFVEAMAEVLDPLGAPRYLVRRGRRYFGVPEWFGRNRERADLFLAAWRRRAGRGRLVYTRGAEGRRHLVRAQSGYLLGYDAARAEVRMRWRIGAAPPPEGAPRP